MQYLEVGKPGLAILHSLKMIKELIGTKKYGEITVYSSNPINFKPINQEAYNNDTDSFGYVERSRTIFTIKLFLVIEILQSTLLKPLRERESALARELGTRFGSPSGYESVQKEGIIWSGILDLYDPDTNSNPGIERRLLEAFPA